MQHKSVRASTIAVLSMAVAGLGLTGCGLKEPPPPFDPLTFQQAEKDASFQGRSKETMYDLPTTLHDLTTQPDAAESEAARTGKGKHAQQAATNPNVRLRPHEPLRHRPRGSRKTSFVRVSLQDIIHRSVIHWAEVKVAGYDPAIAKPACLRPSALRSDLLRQLQVRAPGRPLCRADDRRAPTPSTRRKPSTSSAAKCSPRKRASSRT